MRGSAVVEVDWGGWGGGAVGALLTGGLQGCRARLVTTGHGTSGCGPITASSTIDKMFVLLL